jgi:4-deoxy-L-threo-5-hexosulose-uronate ketol-isomerase
MDNHITSRVTGRQARIVIAKCIGRVGECHPGACLAGWLQRRRSRPALPSPAATPFNGTAGSSSLPLALRLESSLTASMPAANLHDMIDETIRRMPRPQDVPLMNTQQLRETFLINDLFKPGHINATFTDLDRLVVGGAMPLKPLELPNHKETGRAFFLERRELGAINVGGPGVMHADGKSLSLDRLDCAYVPMGTRSVRFENANAKNPAKFYFLSCPAHAAFPVATMKQKDATPVALGSQATANQRTIRKYIHPGGIPSCQLVMGFTELAEGSVWNSFPPHTHNRRTEIYFYFDLADRVLVHLMGEPTQTRHLFIHNEQVALSPAWSIHCGCGSGNYRFIWGMAGENQTFDDMDGVKPPDLR